MAGKRGVKKREGENLTDANIEKVQGLLSAEKPITKKEACAILNIAYNTTRLAKILAEYQESQELDKKRRAANRGKPANDFEIATVIESYLSGESLKEIADTLYRPVDFVKKIIDMVGVPTVVPGENYTNFSPLPEQCVSDEFEVGEFVWASKYGAIAEVIRETGVSSDSTGAKVYQIYVYERVDWDKVETRYAFMPQGDFGGRYAVSTAYDLGSLKHLKPYVKDLTRIIR